MTIAKRDMERNHHMAFEELGALLYRMPQAADVYDNTTATVARLILDKLTGLEDTDPLTWGSPFGREFLAAHRQACACRMAGLRLADLKD